MSKSSGLFDPRSTMYAAGKGLGKNNLLYHSAKSRTSNNSLVNERRIMQFIALSYNIVPCPYGARWRWLAEWLLP